MTYISTSSSEVTTYESVSGDISFDGLGNGTDFSEIIDATIDAESYLKEAYETQLEEQEYIVDMLDQLSDEFDALEEILEEFNTTAEFMEFSVTSTDDAISAVADTSTVPTSGTHTLEVGQLAESDIWINTSTAFDATDDVVTTTATSLTLSYAGEETSVDVPAGTTAEELVDLINAAFDEQIEASLLNDGSQYLLTLSGVDTGADNAISIVDTGDLTLTADGFENTQTACDAWLKVDGYPSDADEWITRSSNEIEDLITGLDLTLTDVTDGAVRLTVGYDTDAMTEKIETFVESVNQIILDIQTVTGRITTYVENDDGEEEEAPAVKSYALDIIYAELKNVLASSANGSTDSDTYSVFSQIGISTDSDEDSETFGQLLLDSDELAEALDNDPKSVAELFAATDEAVCEDGQVAYESMVEGITETGDHDISYVVENGVLVSATIDGEEALIDGWSIEGSADTDAQGLRVSVLDQADGTHDTSLSIKQGKVSELIDALEKWTDSENGTLTILITYCEENIDSLEDQIDSETTRLSALETSLNRRYSSLDATLAEYEALSDTLESLIDELKSSD
ncbi:MAG: flagellar filament capping protein FliD [Desulfovibrio sp.]